MNYKDIKDFNTRCEEHPDHQSGMVTNAMIQQRLHEEIDELRDYIEQAEKQFNPDWDQQAVLVERIRELEAQQALDKKADNARELGLDYEPFPVAWMTNSEQDVTAEFLFSHVQTPMHNIPLYEAPPRKEWVGLTELEVKHYNNRLSGSNVAQEIESKLRERNT